MADSTPVITRMSLGLLQTNCYLVHCTDTRSALVIDPADEPQRIISEAWARRARIEQILLTHAHLDHIMGVETLQKTTGAKLLVHRAEPPMVEAYSRLFGPQAPRPPHLQVDQELEGGEEITIGSLKGTVLHTPGHSPGSITLQVGNALFTGDTLFAQGVGRTDLPGGDLDTLLASIQQLFTLPDECAVYPGHGPASTIGREKRDNPYV